MHDNEGIAKVRVQALERFAARGVGEDRDKAEAVCCVGDWPANRSSEYGGNLSAGRAVGSGAGILRRLEAWCVVCSGGRSLSSGRALGIR